MARLKGMTTRLSARSTSRLPLLLAAVALVPALAACGAQDGPDGSRAVDPINVPLPETPTDTPAESPTDPETTPWAKRIAMSSVDLVAIETSGGMCAGTDGSGQVEGTECRSTLTIAGDGSWQVVEGDTVRSGRLDFEDLTRLTGTLYATDATAKPKDEISCDSWVDGRDVTLTYASATGKDVTVSSCEHDLSDVKLLDVVSRLVG
jgi:hypothetical protein